MGVPTKDFLKKRRDRLVGSILGYAERELFRSLSVEQQKKLRQIVLDAANGYHDSVLDLLGADDGVVRNDELVRLLGEMNDLLDRVQQRGMQLRGARGAHEPAQPH